jgi:hypothetical protein
LSVGRDILVKPDVKLEFLEQFEIIFAGHDRKFIAFNAWERHVGETSIKKSADDNQ